MKILHLIMVPAMVFASLMVFPMSGQAETDMNGKKLLKMEEIVVTGTKTDKLLGEVPVETILITRQEIEDSNAESVSALLRQIPGFNFSQQSDLTGSMGYKNTVRGLNVEARYLLVLVDGQRVFSGYHSGGMSSAGFSHNVNVVPVTLIERIEIVKGPGSALYGSDAVVGVLNIITRRPSEETQVIAGGGYGTYDVGGMDYLGTKPKDKSRYRYDAYAVVGGPISKKVKGMVSFSHEANEGTHAALYDIYRNYVHGRLEIEATDNLVLNAGAEYTVWEEEDESSGDNKKETVPRLYLNADYRIAPRHNLRFKAYYQNLDADFRDPLYGDQKADVSYSDAEIQYTGSVFKNHLVTAGVEYLRESFDTGIVVDKKTSTTSAYVQDEWSLMNGRLVMIPGIRFDDNDVYGQEWNPKFSAMFAFGEDSKIRASVGRSFKAPSALITSAEPINHIVQWVFANPDLKPEKSVTWQIGLEQGFFDRRLRLSTTYYHTSVRDMINYAATGDTWLGLPVLTHENMDEATIQGIEASADLSITGELGLHLNYAYTDARNSMTDERLIDTPEHSFNAMLDYSDSAHDWGGAITFGYSSDQRNLMFAPTASPKTEPFTSVGVNVWKEVMDGCRLTAQVDNLFDEELKGSDTIYAGRSIMARLDLEL
ncbi:TonB-dependent receptor [Prosthecochloris sp. SCSIO W1101]|uniref:TonB-dependent receptor plug domain-containing protein n=1 Tax=Prosthecochloris sp. SCSIO W1101 TaxID=2992242 RepID=UPI00223D41F9|nr:TonB-dependent receptor [Prosthecochloris sp. SCSIO W1101]UZJ40149.1 TonB-dependent receptor [Prosthecochloris sp. SCSIO W1101]